MKHRKFAITICSLVLAFSCLTGVAGAADITYVEPEVAEETGGMAARAEETGWIFRTTEDGRIQKRLWSYTYGRWLTDWIYV